MQTWCVLAKGLKFQAAFGGDQQTWAGSGSGADKLGASSLCVLDDLGIPASFKTSYGTESLQNNNLGNNCPRCWQDNIRFCSVNVFKWNLYSFAFQTVTIIRGCSFPLHCKARGVWIQSDRWDFPRASRATRPWDLCYGSWKPWKFTTSHRLWRIWIPAQYLETQVNFTMIRQTFVEFKMFLWNVWLLQTKTELINILLPGNCQTVLIVIRLTPLYDPNVFELNWKKENARRKVQHSLDIILYIHSI